LLWHSGHLLLKLWYVGGGVGASDCAVGVVVVVVEIGAQLRHCH